MIFLVLVPSPPYVAIRRRELLPRGFTLTLAGGLFSVTAFIRLLPSVLSTAGRPFQSGLSSESTTQRQKRSTYICFCKDRDNFLKFFFLLTFVVHIDKHSYNEEDFAIHIRGLHAVCMWKYQCR